MDFLLAMSIFTNAPDICRDKRKVPEWMRAWVARDDSNRKGAAAEQGAPRRRRQQKEPRAQQVSEPQEGKKELQGGRPWFAPEFDGLNCFETIVSH